MQRCEQVILAIKIDHEFNETWTIDRMLNYTDMTIHPLNGKSYSRVVLSWSEHFMH